MGRFAQVGIAIGALGVVLALMGLFPQLTGAVVTPGIGLVQVTLMLMGYSLLLGGAIIYAKFTFYLGIPPTLIQQIGLRLTMTGIVFAALAGYADIFGFGSHLRTDNSDVFFGGFQAIGLLLSLAMSSFGVVVYAVSGILPEEIEGVRDITQEIPAVKPSETPADEVPTPTQENSAHEA
jgi:hypothetical protein